MNSYKYLTSKNEVIPIMQTIEKLKRLLIGGDTGIDANHPGAV
jgi:hypothetical protein